MKVAAQGGSSYPSVTKRPSVKHYEPRLGKEGVFLQKVTKETKKEEKGTAKGTKVQVETV